MYESFYGFSEKPFSLFPDHRFLFLNRRYTLAISLLEFGVLNKNGMILLTGDPGIGKTTLLHKILADLDESVIVGQLTFTQDKSQSLLPWVLQAFDLPTTHDQSSESFQVLSDYFSQVHQQKRSLLLVVDEAQNLEIEKLEELRLLFNVNDRVGPVFQILLAGHSQLREQLKDEQLSAFVQRIGTDFSLEPLNEEDTMGYVRHRVLLAGGSASLFSEKACHIIFQCTRGIPRLINQLCETCLIYGFSDQASRITETCIAEAAKDRSTGGLFPLTQDYEDTPNTDEDKREDRTSQNAQKEQEVLLETSGDSVSSTQISHEEGRHNPVQPRQTFTQSLPVLEPRQAPVAVPVNLVTNPEKYWNEGLKLRDDGWCLEAIQSLKLAATHSQYRTPAWFQVAQCYLVLGRKPEALKAIRICLNNSTSSPEELARIQYAMAELLEDMGEIDESQRYYQLAYSNDSKFTPKGTGSKPTKSMPGLDKALGAQQENRSSWVVRWFRRIFFLT